MPSRHCPAIAVAALFFQILTGASRAQTSLPLTEPFPYAPGNLVGASGSSWTSLVVTDSPVQVVGGGSLTYAGAPASTGNRIQIASGSNQARQTAVLSFTTQTVGTIYASFLLRANSITHNPVSPTGQVELLTHLGSTPGNPLGPTNRGLLYYRVMSNTTYNLGFRFSNEPSDYATDSLAVGSTVFVVMAYEISASTSSDDRVKLWINPSPASTTPPTPSVEKLNLGAADITPSLFAVCQGFTTPSQFDIDELRIGKSWGDVMGTSSAVHEWTIYE